MKYNAKIVVYTTIIGPYDGLLPQPKFDGIDYVCFTDQNFRSKTWKIIPLHAKALSPARTSRHPKIVPHAYLKEYDYSIYMDGNILLIRNPIPLLKEVLAHAPMGIFDHNQCSDARDCVYKEHQAIIDLYHESGVLKDDFKVMETHMKRYRDSGYPENNGLIVATVMLRNHHHPDVIKTMETWWDEFCHGSKRDQLSFNFAAWKNNFSPFIINGDVRNNPYFYMIGVHRKSYKGKYLRYKLKRIFGSIKHPKPTA